MQIYLGCLSSQGPTREEDHWECYCGLEACMVRIGELRGSVPQVNINWILELMEGYESGVVAFKAHMFLFAMILADLDNHEKYKQVLMGRPLPSKIPIYENKAFLLYLALLTPYLPLGSSSSSLTLLHTLLQLLQN